MNIYISSIGRRNYLAYWFREAAKLMDCPLNIVASDNDPYAPGLAEVDKQVSLPPVVSESYLDKLVETCIDGDISLILSLHDYDIARISDGALERLMNAGITVAVPPRATLQIATDKLLTVETLAVGGIDAPLTVLATPEAVSATTGASVVKHRFGSGSSGVFIVEAEHLSAAITMSSISAPQISGTHSADPDPSSVVVQEKIEGEEFGLDIVCDFQGAFQAVLARKKLRMRAGETDRAITVDSTPFLDLGVKLAATLELRGNTDVDVIVTEEGRQYIIDINPRFGGGYPFVHVAGANVPACYLAWTLDRPIDPAWLRYEIGVVSSKYQAIQRSFV